MRPKRTASICLALCLLALLPGSAHARTTSQRMVAEINAFRAENGLPRLRASRSLTRSSFAYSRWMMRADVFAHAPRIRASSRFDGLGEVLELHRGRRPRVAETVDAWAASPGHRAVLLQPTFDFVGAGRTFGRFHGRRKTVWVVQVGRR